MAHVPHASVWADYCPPISALIEGWRRRLALRGLDGARGWLDIGDGYHTHWDAGAAETFYREVDRFGGSWRAVRRVLLSWDAGREDAGS